MVKFSSEESICSDLSNNHQLHAKSLQLLDLIDDYLWALLPWECSGADVETNLRMKVGNDPIDDLLADYTSCDMLLRLLTFDFPTRVMRVKRHRYSIFHTRT